MKQTYPRWWLATLTTYLLIILLPLLLVNTAHGSSFSRWSRLTDLHPGSNSSIPSVAVSSTLGEMVAILPGFTSSLRNTLSLTRMSSDSGNMTAPQVPFYKDIITQAPLDMSQWSPEQKLVEMTMLVAGGIPSSEISNATIHTFCEASEATSSTPDDRGMFCGVLVFSVDSPLASQSRLWLPRNLTFPTYIGSKQNITSSQIPLFAPDSKGQTSVPWSCKTFQPTVGEVVEDTDCLIMSMEESSASDAGCSVPFPDPSLGPADGTSSLTLLRQGPSTLYVFRPLEVAMETLSALRSGAAPNYTSLILKVPLYSSIVPPNALGAALTSVSFVGVNLPPPGLMAPLTTPTTTHTARMCLLAVGFSDGSITMLDSGRKGSFKIPESPVVFPFELVQHLPFTSTSSEHSADENIACEPTISVSSMDLPFALYTASNSSASGDGFIATSGSLLAITCGHQGAFWTVSPTTSYLSSASPPTWSASNPIVQRVGEYAIPSVPNEPITMRREVMLAAERVAFVALFDLTNLDADTSSSTPQDAELFYLRTSSSGTYVVTITTSTVGRITANATEDAYVCVYGATSNFFPGVVLSRANQSESWVPSPLLPLDFNLTANPIVSTTFTASEALGVANPTAIIPPLYITVPDRITGVLNVQYQHILPIAALASLPASSIPPFSSSASTPTMKDALAFAEAVSQGSARWLLEHGMAVSVTTLQYNLLVNLSSSMGGDPKGAPGNRLAFASTVVSANPINITSNSTSSSPSASSPFVAAIQGGSSFSRSPITLDPYISVFTATSRGDSGNGVADSASCVPSGTHPCFGSLRAWAPVLADSVSTLVQSDSNATMRSIILRSRGLSTGPSISPGLFLNSVTFPPTCIFSLHRVSPARLPDVLNAIMCGRVVGSVATRSTSLLPRNDDCSSSAFSDIAETPLSNGLFGSHRFYVPLRVDFFNSKALESFTANVSFTTYNPYDTSSVFGAPFPVGDVSPVVPWVEVVGQYDANYCANSLQFTGTWYVASNQVVLGSEGGWMIIVDAVGSVTPASPDLFAKGQIEMAFQSATASTTQQTFRSPLIRHNTSSFYVQRTYDDTFTDVVLGLNESSLYPGSERVYFCLGEVMYSYYRVPGNSTWETNLTDAIGSRAICGVPDAMTTAQDESVLFVKVYFERNNTFEEHAVVAMSVVSGQVLGVTSPLDISTKFHGECGAAANAPPPLVRLGTMIDVSEIGQATNYVAGIMAPIIGSRCLCALFVKSGNGPTGITAEWLYSAPMLQGVGDILSIPLQGLVLFSLTFNNFTSFISDQGDSSIILKAASTDDADTLFALLSTPLDILSSALSTVSTVTGGSMVRSDYPYGFVPLLINESVIDTLLLGGLQFLLVARYAQGPQSGPKGCSITASSVPCTSNFTTLVINALDSGSEGLLWTDTLLDGSLPYLVAASPADQITLFQFQADKLCVAYGRVRCYSVLPRRDVLCQYNGTSQSWGYPATDITGLMFFVSDTHPIHALQLDSTSLSPTIVLLWVNLTWKGSETGVFKSIDSTKCTSPFLSGSSMFVSCSPSNVDPLPGSLAHLVIVNALTGAVIATGPWAGSQAQISADAQRLTYANNLLTIISVTFLTMEQVVPFTVHAKLCGIGTTDTYTYYLKDKSDITSILLRLPLLLSDPYVMTNSTINIAVRRQTFIGGHIIGSVFQVSNTEALLPSLGLKQYTGSSITITSEGPLLAMVLDAAGGSVPSILLSTDTCSPCTPQFTTNSSSGTGRFISGTCPVRCTLNKRSGVQYRYTQLSTQLVRQSKPIGQEYFTQFPNPTERLFALSSQQHFKDVGHVSSLRGAKSLDRTDCTYIFANAIESATTVYSFNISGGNLSQVLSRFMFDIQEEQQEILCLEGLQPSPYSPYTASKQQPGQTGQFTSATENVSQGLYCSLVAQSPFMSRWNVVHVFESGYSIDTMTVASDTECSGRPCLMLQSSVASADPLFEVLFQLSLTYELQMATDRHAFSFYPNDESIETVLGSVLVPSAASSSVSNKGAEVVAFLDTKYPVTLQSNSVPDGVCSTMNKRLPPACTRPTPSAPVNSNYLSVAWTGSTSSLLGEGFIRTGTVVPIVWFLRKALAQQNDPNGYNAQQVYPTTREQLAAADNGVKCYMLTSGGIDLYTVCPASCLVNFTSCESQLEGFIQSYLYSLTHVDFMPLVSLQPSFSTQCPTQFNSSIVGTMSFVASTPSSPSSTPQQNPADTTFIYAKVECTTRGLIMFTAVNVTTGEDLLLYTVQEGEADPLTGGTFSCERCVYFLLSNITGQPVTIMLLGSIKALLLCYVFFTVAQLLEKKKRKKLLAKRVLDHMEELQAALLMSLGRGEEVVERRWKKATLPDDYKNLSDADKAVELQHVKIKLDIFRSEQEKKGICGLSSFFPNPIDLLVTVMLELLSIDEEETKRKARRLLTHSLVAPILSEKELAVHLASVVSSKHLEVGDFADHNNMLFRNYAAFYAQYLSGGYALIRGDIEEELSEVSEKVSQTMQEEFVETTGAVYLSFLAFQAMYSRFLVASSEDMATLLESHPVLHRVMTTITASNSSNSGVNSTPASKRGSRHHSRARMSLTDSDLQNNAEEYVLLMENGIEGIFDASDDHSPDDVNETGGLLISSGAEEGYNSLGGTATSTSATRTRRQRRRKEREAKQQHLKEAAQRLMNKLPTITEPSPLSTVADVSDAGREHVHEPIHTPREGGSGGAGGSHSRLATYAMNSTSMMDWGVPMPTPIPLHSQHVSTTSVDYTTATANTSTTHNNTTHNQHNLTTGSEGAIGLTSTIGHMSLAHLADQLKKTRAVITERRDNFRSHFLKSTMYTHAIDEYLRPNKLLLWVGLLQLMATQVVYAIDVFPRAYSAGLSSLETYQVIYFMACNSSTFAGLLGDALARADWEHADQVKSADGITFIASSDVALSSRNSWTPKKFFNQIWLVFTDRYVLLTMLLFSPPLVTHVIPGMMLYMWLFLPGFVSLSVAQVGIRTFVSQILSDNDTNSDIIKYLRAEWPLRRRHRLAFLLRSFLRLMIILFINLVVSLSFSYAAITIYNKDSTPWDSSDPYKDTHISKISSSYHHTSYIDVISEDYTSRRMMCFFDGILQSVSNFLQSGAVLFVF